MPDYFFVVDFFHIGRFFVIAVDGESASGKGTIASSLAKGFGLPYLDTGKLYRIVALRVIEVGAKTDEEIFDISSNVKDGFDFAWLDNKNFLLSISSEEVGGVASKIAAMKFVRNNLLDLQRSFVENSDKGAVLDGRDIATVVYPNADYKLYITASVDIRAERRLKQLQDMKKCVNYESVYRDLVDRDARDSSRDCAPLIRDPSAVLLETTNMTVEESVSYVVDDIRSKFFCN